MIMLCKYDKGILLQETYIIIIYYGFHNYEAFLVQALIELLSISFMKVEKILLWSEYYL